MKNQKNITAGSFRLIIQIVSVMSILISSAFAQGYDTKRYPAVFKHINDGQFAQTTTLRPREYIYLPLPTFPRGTSGEIRIKLKWHTFGLRRSFQRLNVQLTHGNRVLLNRDCFSIHSPKGPKCNINYSASRREVFKEGQWQIKITNKSRYKIVGLNYKKGNDNSARMPNFRSEYHIQCPKEQNLSFRKPMSTIYKKSSQMIEIYNVPNTPGLMDLEASWKNEKEDTAVGESKYNLLKLELVTPTQNHPGWGDWGSGYASILRKKLYSSSRPFQPYRKRAIVSASFGMTDIKNANRTATWRLKISNDDLYFNQIKFTIVTPKYRAGCRKLYSA